MTYHYCQQGLGLVLMQESVMQEQQEERKATHQLRIRRLHFGTIFTTVLNSTVRTRQIFAIVIASKRQLNHRTYAGIINISVVPVWLNIYPLPSFVINSAYNFSRVLLHRIFFFFGISWITISANLFL